MSLLTSDQVQKKLGITRSTLYLWVREEKLHPLRAGRALLFEEDEIMTLLGQGTSVAGWLGGGVLEEAKTKVKQWVRTGVRPHVFVQYLQAPAKDFIRCRVLSTGAGQAIEYPAPGGMTFDSCLEAKKSGRYIFLGSEESVWKLADVRPEKSPSGVPYIALDLVPVRTEGQGSERDARIREILARMEEGPIKGKLTPYRREDLYARGSR